MIKYVLIIALVISTVTSVKKSECPLYNCSANPPSTDTGICASKSTKDGAVTFTFNQCKNDYACGISLGGVGAAVFMATGTTISCVPTKGFGASVTDFFSNAANTIKTTTLDVVGKGACDIAVKASVGRVDGQDCQTNSNCYDTLECVSDKCKGKANGTDCSNDKHCAKGLACISSKCSSQKASGAACTREYECANNLTCGNDVCVPYYSLADGKVVKLANACKGKVVDVNATDGTMTCDSLSISTSNCTGDKDSCTYKYSVSGKTIDAGCTCKGEFNSLQERVCMDPNDSKTLPTYNDVQTTLRYMKDINPCPGEVKKVSYGSCIDSVFGSTAFIKNSILVILSVLAILF